MNRTKSGHSFEVHGFLSSVSISIVALPAAFVIVLITSISAKSTGLELASLLFTGPLIGQVIVQPIIAIRMRAVSLQNQTMISLLVRIILAILSLYLIMSLISVDSALRADHYFVYGVWTVLSIVDQPLAVRLNLFNCRYNNFSFLRSNSISNLLGRGSMALAPFFVVTANRYLECTLWILLILSYLCSLYAPWHILKRIVSECCNQGQGTTEETKRSLHLDRMLSWENWFLLFQFLANASIGAIGFLLLSSSKYEHFSPPPYSVLYSIFLLVQAILVLKLIKLENYATPRTVRNMFFLISVAVVINGQCNDPATIMASTIVLGFLYSLLLPLLAETVARKIADHRLPQYMMIGKSVGRIASIAAIWLAGWALGNSIPTAFVQLSFGLIGAISVILLVIIERRL
ncbi:hypothetical protein [Advenella mimigardefordensis]|uniref:hypothetical protein n=1 Tax=Advenella mimigardefordensis TaxID=302406 RepID=UPI0004ACB2D0|nr:hypothetical protein [Advenella mimigardefordensis]